MEKINKTDYIFNMLRLEGVRVNSDSIPTLLKKITTYDVSANELWKIDNIIDATEYAFSIKTPQYADIFKINQYVQKGWDEAGAIRHSPVKITGTNYEPPVVNEALLKSRLIKYIKCNNISCAVHAMLNLMKLQIFNDGNKRTAQLFASALLKNKVISIPLKYQSDFKKYLLEYYEGNADEPTKDFYEFITNLCIFKRGDF